MGEGCDTSVPEMPRGLGELRPNGLRRLGGEIDTRAIQINECLNGFIVQVGCRSVVFETKEKMLKELSRYLDNREQVEKEYLGLK